MVSTQISLLKWINNIKGSAIIYKGMYNDEHEHLYNMIIIDKNKNYKVSMKDGRGVPVQ